MKQLCTVTIVVLGLLAGPAAAHADVEDFRVTRLDHQAHMAVSYSLTLTGALVLEHKADVKRPIAMATGSAGHSRVGGRSEELVIDDPGGQQRRWSPTSRALERRSGRGIRFPLLSARDLIIQTLQSLQNRIVPLPYPACAIAGSKP